MPRSSAGSGGPQSPPYDRSMNAPLRIVLKVFGIGALVAGGLVVAVVATVAALLCGPLLFWVAWNVLDLAHSIGLPELGFWGILLAAVFLLGGWLVKVVTAGLVFLIDPSWFHGAAQVHWPDPTFRAFVAIAIVAVLASRPHARAQGGKGKARKRRADRPRA